MPVSRENQVQDRMRRLQTLGYYPYQIDHIMEECVGTANWTQLSTDQLDSLCQSLDQYIQFAEKCRKLNR